MAITLEAIEHLEQTVAAWLRDQQLDGDSPRHRRIIFGAGMTGLGLPMPGLAADELDEAHRVAARLPELGAQIADDLPPACRKAATTCAAMELILAVAPPREALLMMEDLARVVASLATATHES